MTLSDSTCIELEFFSGGYRIKGNLHLPSVKNPPVVIGSHGLFSTQESPKQIALAKACNLLGMAFFRFDHRGCGQSEGEISEQVSFRGRCNDLLKACETIRKRSDTANEIALFGSSFGGSVVCAVSSRTQPESLVTFAAPSSSRCIFSAIDKSGLATEYPQTIFENLTFDNEQILCDIQNILIVHGDRDDVVPVSEAQKIYKKVSHPKKLIIQKSGDHRMSDKAHQDYFVKEASNWLAKGFTKEKVCKWEKVVF